MRGAARGARRVLHCLSPGPRARAPGSPPRPAPLGPLPLRPGVGLPLGVCRGTRGVDSLGRLGSGVSMGRPWRRRLLSLPSWAAPREAAPFAAGLVPASPGLPPCPTPSAPASPGRGSSGSSPRRGGEPAGWKTSTVTQCGEGRAPPVARRVQNREGRGSGRVQRCHRPASPGCLVATPHALGEPGRWGPGAGCRGGAVLPASPRRRGRNCCGQL